MDLDEFNVYYLSNLLGNLSGENKTVLLLSDFNIDLLKYDHNSPQMHFLTTPFFPYVFVSYCTTKKKKK